jgi:hypothetical protein
MNAELVPDRRMSSIIADEPICFDHPRPVIQMLRIATDEATHSAKSEN